jgi:hypothetical protein
MTNGDWIASAGDLLVLVGLGLTYVVYRRQSFDSYTRQVRSAVAVLRAVRNGVSLWGDQHFGGDGYTAETAWKRAQDDYVAVKAGTYSQNFRVPVEPIVALIQQPGEGRFINRATIEAANIALWRLGSFNQLVQQQTDFNALYLSQGQALGDEQREELAKAARQISMMIHESAIGDAQWYRNLMRVIETNIHDLERLLPGHWWHPRVELTERTGEKTSADPELERVAWGP